jgi:hypothetical protein
MRGLRANIGLDWPAKRVSAVFSAKHGIGASMPPVQEIT